MGYTALFGGTFNPPHIGHLRMLEALEGKSDIDEIWLMPDRIPPHKVCDFLATDDDRINMCRLLISGLKKTKICLIEFERTGKSYSYDTLKLLKQKYPERRFTFVCGGDMLISFDKWYKYEELLKEVPFTVFRRTETDKDGFDKAVLKYSEMGMKITVCDDDVPEVSSSFIRNNIEKSADFLPEKVYKYIVDGRIYGGKHNRL
ncbi:MAG: nicotinate (nicotinamide) nucleotide adenylyltransferase [Acutalibacteraceae bacterium]|nr:nicotinate (nicotinamide) nucleotide adenylyltransferase [Clostridia bacterium]MEE1330063.1 nicotinate (nicotinamide) nucleotide adenylyltransferase [Acutalibacteraceae bacterium]